MPFHAPSAAIVQGNSPNQDPACTDPNPFNCGPDRHYTIIDQTNHKEIDLWHAQVSPLGANTTVPAGGAGYTLFDSNDGLAFGNSVADGANAGRYGNLAGRVRIEELNDAIAKNTFINHALTITVNCTSGGTIYPARDNHGQVCSNTVTDAPPMGARIHLNLQTGSSQGDLNLINSFTSVPPWKKVFLRTLVVYGAIINDTGSSFYFDWQLESGNQYTASLGTFGRLPPNGDLWWQFGHDQAAQQTNQGIVTDWFDDQAGGWKGLWQNSRDTASNFNWGMIWNSQNLEILDSCVSDGSC